MSNLQNKSLEKITLSNKPRLVITQKLQNQIEWLHKNCGAVEWSGELITREIGKITDLDDWVIIAEDIFLVDVGSSAFTGYNFNEGAFKAADVMELYDKFDGIMEGTHKAQHIHTHQGMGTFFSGTDWSQLNDRGCESNYFLMLITNFKNQHIAKVGFKANSKTTTSGLSFANDVENSFGSLQFNDEADKEVLVVMDCIVEIETLNTDVDISDLNHLFDTFSKANNCEKQSIKDLIGLLSNKVDKIDVEAWFENRFKHVKQAIKPIKDYSQGSFDSFLNPNKPKQKGLMEMNDKEWGIHNTTFAGHNDLLMGQREGFILMNKFLTKDSFKNASSPIDALIELNTKLKTKTEILNWVQNLEYCIHDLFLANFPQGDEEDFENILVELYEYFLEYKYNRVISELCNSLDQMLQYSLLK